MNQRSEDDWGLIKRELQVYFVQVFAIHPQEGIIHLQYYSDHERSENTSSRTP